MAVMRATPWHVILAMAAVLRTCVAVATVQQTGRAEEVGASSLWDDQNCSWVAATLYPCLTANTVLSQLTAMEEQACCDVVSAFHAGGCFCVPAKDRLAASGRIDKERLVTLAGLLESCIWTAPICDDEKAAAELRDWVRLAAFTSDHSSGKAAASLAHKIDLLTELPLEGDSGIFEGFVEEDDNVDMDDDEVQNALFVEPMVPGIPEYRGLAGAESPPADSSQRQRAARLRLSSPGSLDMTVEVQQRGGSALELEQTVNELSQWMTSLAAAQDGRQPGAQDPPISLRVVTALLGRVVDLARETAGAKGAQMEVNMEVSVEMTRSTRSVLPPVFNIPQTVAEEECNCFFANLGHLLRKEPALFISFAVAAVVLCALGFARQRRRRRSRPAASHTAASVVVVAAEEAVLSDLEKPLLEADGRERVSGRW